jgi:hypothetical protein
MGQTVTIQKGDKRKKSDINGKNGDHSERGQEKEIQKPMGVPDYRNHIGGIDRSDHYCTTHFSY